MKLKHLESALSPHDWTFPSPDVALEQYPTSPHLASQVLFSAESMFEDIGGKQVLDLGSGTGILSVGAALLNASHVMGADIDLGAIEKALVNCSEADVSVDFIHTDLITTDWCLPRRVDTVVMNPPFGTRTAGVDVQFLALGLKLADSAVYSLHKSSTREYLVNKCREWHKDVQVVAQLKFDLPKAYSFHKQKSVDVLVDLLRVSHRPE